MSGEGEDLKKSVTDVIVELKALREDLTQWEELIQTRGELIRELMELVQPVKGSNE